MTSSDSVTPRPKRSDFLTLLCVLTFLSCGLGLIDSVTSYTRTDAVARTERIERREQPRQTDPNAKPEYFEDRSNSDDPIPGDPEEIRPLAAAGFFYSLLTLIGAVLMFFQRRLGFYVYVLGVLVGLIAPIALLGMNALQTSFGVFFSFIFVGLYAYCLKELR